MLDTTPLGRLVHRRPDPAGVGRLDGLLAAGDVVLLPEVADYELRRNLLLHGFAVSVRKLDALKAKLPYVPITTPAMVRAAGLWADARRGGRPTADPRELDCDVILAAQALEAGAVVATANVGHLSRYVTVIDWQSIAAPPPP